MTAANLSSDDLFGRCLSSYDDEERFAQREKLKADLDLAAERVDTLVRGKESVEQVYQFCLTPLFFF